MNKLINREAVYRTAPTTLGLLKIMIYFNFLYPIYYFVLQKEIGMILIVMDYDEDFKIHCQKIKNWKVQYPL